MLTQASEFLTRPPLARFSKRIQVAFISHTGHSASTTPPVYTTVVVLAPDPGTTTATGTFNTVATSTAGPRHSSDTNATVISKEISTTGVQAPFFATVPASSAATAPDPPAAATPAKDGQSTGALCPAHNLSSALLIRLSLLDSRVLTPPLQVLWLRPKMSQVVFPSHTHKPFLSLALKQFYYSGPG